jgi:hypothetical protein
MVHPYGILEMARTGAVALSRGAKVLSTDRKNEYQDKE